MSLTINEAESERGPLQVDELPMNSQPICHQRRRGNVCEFKHLSQKKGNSHDLTLLATTYHYLTRLDLPEPRAVAANRDRPSEAARIGWEKRLRRHDRSPKKEGGALLWIDLDRPNPG